MLRSPDTYESLSALSPDTLSALNPARARDLSERIITHSQKCQEPRHIQKPSQTPPKSSQAPINTATRLTLPAKSFIMSLSLTERTYVSCISTSPESSL